METTGGRRLTLVPRRSASIASPASGAISMPSGAAKKSSTLIRLRPRLRVLLAPRSNP